MVKIRKRIASIAAAAVMGVSMVSGTCMSASAAQVVSKYGVFDWNVSRAFTTNKTNSARLVSTSFTVYRDNTGAYVTQKTASNSGSYGTQAYVSNPNTSVYVSNGYNFRCRGAIYYSTNSNSGLAWDTHDKSID